MMLCSIPSCWNIVGLTAQLTINNGKKTPLLAARLSREHMIALEENVKRFDSVSRDFKTNTGHTY